MKVVDINIICDLTLRGESSGVEKLPYLIDYGEGVKYLYSRVEAEVVPSASRLGVALLRATWREAEIYPSGRMGKVAVKSVDLEPTRSEVDGNIGLYHYFYFGKPLNAEVLVEW